PVKTPADGQIWATGSSSGGYGNFVIVAHPNANNPTSLTMYGHLKEPVAFIAGTVVSSGSELGLSGNTGKSTGPHLHYEERLIKPGETEKNRGQIPIVFQFNGHEHPHLNAFWTIKL
ncbi:MAG: M23 family metallopeptidase, partial [Polaromonas sp.]